MNKLIKYAPSVLAVVGLIVGILRYYQEVKPNNPRVEILEISNDNLTNLPTIRNLKSEFYYNDSLISNLWKINASIQNIGPKTIIGKGNKKNLIGSGLTLKLEDGFNILNFNVNYSDFPFEVRKGSNQVSLTFNQWRKNEKFEITVYAEQIAENQNAPVLVINEREIVDGIVTYNKLSQQATSESKLIDLAPPLVKVPLFWFGIIIYAGMALVLIITYAAELKKLIVYRKWKKRWLSKFNQEIGNFPSHNKLNISTKPTEASKEFWLESEIPKPFPPESSLVGFSFVFFILFVLTIIPILWMVNI